MMNSVIEFWDLDVMEPVQPLKSLTRQNGHKAAVTALAMHSSRHNFLLSGSADRTVKLWDISKDSTLLSIDLPSRAQSVSWDSGNDSVGVVLDENSNIVFFDARSPENKQNFKINTKVENISQHPMNHNLIYYCGEKGEIGVFDIKAG